MLNSALWNAAPLFLRETIQKFGRLRQRLANDGRPQPQRGAKGRQSVAFGASVHRMKSKHTAILSVHGIGRHRRYANAGALLSAIEAVAGSNAATPNTIIEVKPGIERPRIDQLQADIPVLYLRRARRRQGNLIVGSAFRVYEVNWSPDTREPMPVRSMLTWTAALIGSIFRREPKSWLEWPRLKSARLRLSAELASRPAERHALAVLASAYRNYRGSLGVSHRAHNGTKPRFSDFVTFAKHHAKEAVTTSHLEAAAESWQHTRLPTEVSVRSAGWTALTGLFISGLVASAAAIPFMVDAHLGTFTHVAIPVLLALIATSALVLATRFLKTVFSDVRYWSALSENDRFHDTRNAVLDRTIATIRHLVSDPACTRVVIVSHSLGTAIAYDALRAIGLYNLARDDSPDLQIEIRKVDCFITLGSPIDKLALLFETTRGRSFREELMGEQLRGDMTSAPFWVKGKQRIKWLNFWDPADPVSDRLYIPLGAQSLGDRFQETSIENIEVANTPLFDPAGSHTGYLNNPNVAARIFNEIFRPQQLATGTKLEYNRTRIWSRRLIIFIVFCLSILLLSFTLVHLLDPIWYINILLWVSFINLMAGVSGLIVLGMRPS